jgi:hypothetical protein
MKSRLRVLLISRMLEPFLHFPYRMLPTAISYCQHLLLLLLLLLLRPFIGLLYQPWTADGDDFGAISGMSDCHGKAEY